MSGIVKGIKKVVKGVVKVITGVVKAVVDVVSSVVNFVVQPFLGLFGGYDVPNADQEAARQQGVQGQRTGSVTPIPVVYGYRKVGGAVTFAETGSSNNQYLWVAYVLSEGTVEGLREIFIDDNQLPADIIANLNNGQTVDITTGKYKNRVRLQFSHGLYFSDPSTSTLGTWSICKDAPSWKPTMVYNGMAVLFARYYWKKVETQEDADSNPFSGNIPEIKACLLGKKVASLTSGTPSSYTYANAPVRYSTNPAECLLDYLRNPRYGKGLSNDDIDWTSWEATAAKLNQEVEYVSGIRGPIHTFNYVVDTANTLFNNVKSMLPNFRCYMPYVQGKFKLRVEDAGNASDITSGSATIVATFTEDNIQGPITYTAIEATSKYNQVSVTYVNPDNKWSNDTIVYPETEAERQTYIDKDGGRVNKLDVTFGGITNYAIAKDMAKLMFNKSRYQESCSLTVTSQGLELEVGDNIRVQGHLLDFGTTPWRIVSIKYNNDMTVELGCVRNPDTIYPHTRYNEEDIVLPVYTPRGATILYPEFNTTVPIGLVPPSNAETPVVHYPPVIYGVSPQTYTGAQVTTITVTGVRFQTGLTAIFIGEDGTQITPTSVTRVSETEIEMETTLAMDNSNQPYDIKITNSPTFGSLSCRQNNVIRVDGVEPAPSPPIQDPPEVEPPEDPIITPTPTPTPPEGPPITNPPEPTPEPLPLTDVADITEIDYTVDVDLVYADIYFIQPENPAYELLQVYYRRQSAAEPWRYQEVTDKPGPGGTASFRMGPFAKTSTNLITVRTRVKYVTGEFSTKINSIFLNPATAEDTTEPKDFQETVGQGWTPPTPGEVTDRDNKIATLVGQTVLSSSQPTNPRSIDFTLTQDIQNYAVNFDVNGCRIYYKPSNLDEWEYQDYLFGDSYVPGTTKTVRLADLGSPTYPSIPSTAQNNYDFIFRLKYVDGKESSNQIRYMGVGVERNAFQSLDYNPLYGEYAYNEDSTKYNIKLTDPSAPSNKDLITVNVDTLFADYNGENIRLFLIPPHASFLADWAGINVRTRKIEPGTDPDYTDNIITSVGLTTEGKWFSYIPITYEDEYEIVITPLYWSGGQRLESKYSWLGSGYITNRTTGADIPTNGFPPNFVQKYNFRQLTTADALKEVDKPFPAPVNPRINIEKWQLVVPKSYDNAPNAYFQLVFKHNHINNYVKLNIYRRYYNPNYYSWDLNRHGAGRWEKVEITTTNAGGTVTANLKFPLSYQEYNPYFNPSNAESSSNVKLRLPGWVETSVTSAQYYQYIAVVETTSGESTVGLFLPAILGINTQGTYQPQAGGRVIEVDPTDYSDYAVALGKNLNQAITPLADSARRFGYKYFNTYTLTTVNPVRK